MRPRLPLLMNCARVDANFTHHLTARLRLKQSSQSSFHNFHSSVVSPSVFHIIPELQRGQSSYSIDHSDSSLFSATSDWYTSFGDIDYLWSVVPTAQSLTESVKAAVLDSYTDSSLPTILQPRFKPKAPGTALALWVPNIMASLAKRFTEETPSDLAPGGDKNKDIVRQNIGLLLKKDFITANWPFKGTKPSDELSDQPHVQKTRRKVGGVTNHRTKVKHFRRGDTCSDHKLDSGSSSPSTQDSKTMDRKLSWRGPWRKSTRIKYVEASQNDTKSQDSNDADAVDLKTYDSTPALSRRRPLSQDFDSERSSSAELPLSPGSPAFLDDGDESMVFFNYSDDGTSYTCTMSPIRSLNSPDSASEQSYSTCPETFSMLTPVTSAYSIDSDSEDEEELYNESFRMETEHIDCECIKYSRDEHDDFPYLKILDDSPSTENKEPDTQTATSNHHEHDQDQDVESPREKDELKRVGSKGKGKFKLKRVPSLRSSRQRRLTDSGRVPPNSHKEDGEASKGTTSEDPIQLDMKEKIEYMRVAIQENANISAKLYIRVPDKVHLCKIQTHLLLCAMRAFFTCTEGIQVRWVKSFHNKIYQLLQRSDTKIKFSCPDDFMESENTVCLLLSHDASVLLRDRQSSLLSSVADILQIKTDNLLVLELKQKTSPSPPKKSKTKTKKLLDLEESNYCLDTQAEWFLPIFL